MKQAILLAALFFSSFVVRTSMSLAQESTPRSPLQPSDTSSPRATLHSFIDACNELYDLAKAEEKSDEFLEKILPVAERIRDCLDLSSFPRDLRDSVGVETAVYLKEVLDRIELPVDNEIPGAGTIETETNAHWRIPGTRLTMTRIGDGPQIGAYVFSTETVQQAARIYGVAKKLPYRSEGPKVSPDFQSHYTALTKRQPTLSADTSSPRGTLKLFLDSTQEMFEISRSEKYVTRTDPKYLPVTTQTLKCLDVSKIPEYSQFYYAREAAVCLKETLDRVKLPSIEAIPGPEDLRAMEDGQPLTRWQIPNTNITISRMTEGPRRGEYLFTAETVARAVELYEDVKEQPYRTDGLPISPGFHEWFFSTPGNSTVGAVVDWLPDSFRARQFGMTIWQWLGVLLATFIAGGLMLWVYRVGRSRSEKMREISVLRYWVSMVFVMVAMLIPLAFKHIVWDYLTVRGNALYVINFCADFVFLLALIVVILAISHRLADSFVAWARDRFRKIDATLVQILFRSLGIVVALIVFLEGGSYLGFPLTTLLASAGIGGLAIALSAQGMIRGLFGTVTLLMDRPYSVGDRIVAKGQDGVVEEIGLRSTKIRAYQTGHLISIPNDQMADTEIENIGKREHIRRLTDLHVPIDTAREQVETAVLTIRTILENHEGMDPEFPPRVYFNEFNPDSFNIRIICWYSPPDLWSYYAFCEKVNLKIFRAFEEQGIQFSLPLRHSYWKTDDNQGPLEVQFLGNRASNFDTSESSSTDAEPS